jgi:hypothetical protein
MILRLVIVDFGNAKWLVFELAIKPLRRDVCDALGGSRQVCGVSSEMPALHAGNCQEGAAREAFRRSFVEFSQHIVHFHVEEGLMFLAAGTLGRIIDLRAGFAVGAVVSRP